jgi:nucleotide-binding universal stress UspA family protein
MKSILVATDFSPASRFALEVASRLAHEHGARLTILHVEPGQPTAWMGPAYYDIPDPNISDIARLLAAQKPASVAVEFEHLIQAGDPVTQIQRVAEERSVDLIVIGSRSRPAVPGFLLGSVAKTLCHKSACPLLICHEPAAPQRPKADQGGAAKGDAE